MSEERVTFCRFCGAFCPIRVTIEDGRATRVIGLKENELYAGYSCIKGRALPDQHNDPNRILNTLTRGSDGVHRPIAVEEAMDAVAEQLGRIIEEHGPRSVALYSGTYSYIYPPGDALSKSFMEAIGSPMLFTPSTMDQPGKPLSIGFHGRWDAGPQSFADSDVWMLVGTNPVVSRWGGIPHSNPAKQLHDAKKRGMKLIVVDPRRSDCAKKADVFLQPKPGEDPTLLAGLVHIILEEDGIDHAFVEANVEGLAALREAVARFTPDYVAARADVPADRLIEAARVFARAERGMASAGTGPNMAYRGTLTEYLVLVLNTLCGRWVREGERVTFPMVTMPPKPWNAQALPRPEKVYGFGEKMRVRGLSESLAGLPISAAADEILLEGEGQIRALLILGGNPMAAWPDQLRTHAALQALELSLTFDLTMTATAKLCDYIVAPKLSLESAGITQMHEGLGFYGVSHGYAVPYAQYAEKVVDPPAGSEVIEEWEFFYGLGQRMGLQLDVRSQALDMENKPTGEEIIELLCTGSRIPLEEVKRYPYGYVFDDPPVLATPREEGWTHKLDVGSPEMMRELREVRAEPFFDHAGYEETPVFSHRMISRRLHNFYNSGGQQLERLKKEFPYNPAFMNPEELKKLGLESGEVVEISGAEGSIHGIVEPDPDVRPGVISMAHAWGGAPSDDDKLRTIGSNTGRLSSNSGRLDPRSGQPLMSAIPVNLTKLTEVAQR
ncbi:MAG: molybdopterin dinucleotide-binding protein [Deltaproteobacteria bacterium]|nr:molybdopterin dinucleotide-binding protein [Deltaproteobacteria bacterium]